jgi:UDP-N-acetylglucosamine 2-epimerase (non-hydrolysing)
VIGLVGGARPNFVKLAPVVWALRRTALSYRIVHTGQHYDDDMSGRFFKDLRIPEPDVYLGAGSGTPGAQTARILERCERQFLGERPAAMVVFGDVNSTLACALAAVKVGVPVVHVEAGLRSFDRTMPEEINRLLTDVVADLLFVTEPSGLANLAREGIAKERTRLVGNVMIDTLLAELPTARACAMATRLGLRPKQYGVVTVHRPSNVDDPPALGALVELLHQLSDALPLVWPVHPRTVAAARRSGLASQLAQGQRTLICVEPLPYHDMLSLVADAAVVLTDSGGLQEETSALGVPCLTLRETTERPITVERGTSRLVGTDPTRIVHAFRDATEGRWPRAEAIPLWDGKASERLVTQLVAWHDGLALRR